MARPKSEGEAEGRVKERDALAARLKQCEEENAGLVQVSAELCERCGWAMVFPGIGCQKCLLVIAEARLRQCEEALRGLCDKLDEIEKASRSVFTMAAIHGAPYQGPNWIDEYNAARAALTPAPASTTPTQEKAGE